MMTSGAAADALTVWRPPAPLRPGSVVEGSGLDLYFERHFKSAAVRGSEKLAYRSRDEKGVCQ
jgi:hypothetical protein